MSSLTIRNLDPALKERLRIRAAERGHSMEAEVRSILQSTLSASPGLSGRDLCARIQARFAPFGEVDLELPARGPGRELPTFD
jgi:plasmid stability protein